MFLIFNENKIILQNNNSVNKEFWFNEEHENDNNKIDEKLEFFKDDKNNNQSNQPPHRRPYGWIKFRNFLFEYANKIQPNTIGVKLNDENDSETITIFKESVFYNFLDKQNTGFKYKKDADGKYYGPFGVERKFVYLNRYNYLKLKEDTFNDKFIKFIDEFKKLESWIKLTETTPEELNPIWFTKEKNENGVKYIINSGPKKLLLHKDNYQLKKLV